MAGEQGLFKSGQLASAEELQRQDEVGGGGAWLDEAVHRQEEGGGTGGRRARKEKAAAHAAAAEGEKPIVDATAAVVPKKANARLTREEIDFILCLCTQLGVEVEDCSSDEEIKESKALIGKGNAMFRSIEGRITEFKNKSAECTLRRDTTSSRTTTTPPRGPRSKLGSTKNLTG